MCHISSAQEHLLVTVLNSRENISNIEESSIWQNW